MPNLNKTNFEQITLHVCSFLANWYNDFNSTYLHFIVAKILSCNTKH